MVACSMLESMRADELLLISNAAERWDNIVQSGPFRVCKRYRRGLPSGLQRAGTLALQATIIE